VEDVRKRAVPAHARQVAAEELPPVVALISYGVLLFLFGQQLGIEIVAAAELLIGKFELLAAQAQRVDPSWTKSRSHSWKNSVMKLLER